MIGNVYYVGTSELSSYLITTSAGNILINSSYESSVPVIRQAVEKLGFKFADTKILLISHAHDDHTGGSALAKKLTGAKFMVMDADVPVVEGGGVGDFAYKSRWPVTKVDRVLHDGDTVTLGEARADGASDGRPHQGLHDLDDESSRWRQNLQCGDRRQPQCQCRLQAGEQRSLSADRRRLRAAPSAYGNRSHATFSWARTATTTACRRSTGSCARAAQTRSSIRPDTAPTSRRDSALLKRSYRSNGPGSETTPEDDRAGR